MNADHDTKILRLWCPHVRKLVFYSNSVGYFEVGNGFDVLIHVVVEIAEVA